MALRRRRTELPLLTEEEVYARSYGERSDDVTNVKPLELEPEPEPRKPLSDRALRDAFLARLDRRGEV
ncbi:MAG: hypothetical protein E6F98_05145 [Actinobacteria bacterium]|nr:MAG: hypothetical protein E6F98_05145 [Actinomycetota bacterium]